MLNKLRLRKQAQTVMGYRLDEPRPTLILVLWAFIYVGLPLIVVSSLVDLLIQQITGNCTGFWCWF
ncbi:hypothetical protein B9Z35_01290 [Limnohabitans sp. Jir61]|jgi:hypothetical protein|uniref:hypothetical protein n=1 Tax=Limnohabitans sp. Jir61 TaxID=1826168 RepID=UPI000D36A812|nr:hypothetical protein [Limnohabitans sp. Jir61]PUE32216.1 hypothetical protein B9Z35_01290 [Limnohabitans sp. Jir61]